MFIKCEVGNEKYDRYITGKLVNPQQMIPCETNLSEIPDSDVLVAAYPLNDTDVEWIDEFGDLHTSKLLKGKPIAVPKKFIVER